MRFEGKLSTRLDRTYAVIVECVHVLNCYNQRCMYCNYVVCGYRTRLQYVFVVTARFVTLLSIEMC